MPPRRRRAVRARGTGSITTDRDGFRAVITVPTLGGSTETLRRRFTDYAEAGAWLDGIVAQRLGSGVVEVTSPEEIPTFEEYAARWLDRHRSQFSPKTVRLYSDAASRWINPILGTIRLDRLRRRDIQRLVEHLATTPGARGRPLGWDTQHIHWRYVRTLMNAAREDGLITTSPVHRDDQPRRSTAEREVTVTDRAIPDEVLGLLGATLMADEYNCTAANHSAGRCRALWLLRMSTAVRQGEVLVLSVGDVDLFGGRDQRVVGGLLTLNKHLERVPWQHGCDEGDECRTDRKGDRCPRRTGGGLIAAPGLKGARRARSQRRPRPEQESRALHLDEALAQALDVHMRTTRATDDQPLFPRDGRPSRGFISAEHDRLLWSTLIADAGLDAHWRVHDLRHTALTSMARQGVGPHQLRAVAGHSESATTARYYVHHDAQFTVAGVEASSAHLMDLARRTPRLLPPAADEQEPEEWGRHRAVEDQSENAPW